MTIIKSNEININENVLLYKWLSEGNEEVGKVHIIFFENGNTNNNKHNWNVWETVTCNNLKDYAEFKSNKKIKEELESDIKTYINYQEGDKVSIIVYPISDDKEVLKELAQDLMQQYSILSNNRKNKVIDIFDL